MWLVAEWSNGLGRALVGLADQEEAATQVSSSSSSACGY
jgi:hypothetical protein